MIDKILSNKTLLASVSKIAEKTIIENFEKLEVDEVKITKDSNQDKISCFGRKFGETKIRPINFSDVINMQFNGMNIGKIIEKRFSGLEIPENSYIFACKKDGGLFVTVVESGKVVKEGGAAVLIQSVN